MQPGSANASQAQQTLDRSEKAEEFAKAISDLLDRENWAAASEESVLNEARFCLANAEAQGVEAQPPEPPAPLDKLMERVPPAVHGRGPR
jgi:hypothetical protein